MFVQSNFEVYKLKLCISVLATILSFSLGLYNFVFLFKSEQTLCQHWHCNDPCHISTLTSSWTVYCFLFPLFIQIVEDLTHTEGKSRLLIVLENSVFWSFGTCVFGDWRQWRPPSDVTLVQSVQRIWCVFDVMK